MKWRRSTVSWNLDYYYSIFLFVNLVLIISARDDYKNKLFHMNMRQQRITTSQQEVYLIYLMEHTEFAASRIKDGDCCCSFFSFSSFGSHLYIFFWELCASFLSSCSSLPDAQLTGESKYDDNWKELTKMLNNTLGPKKTVDEWKMVRHC